MTQEVLLRFLDKGLIDVDGNDERLKHLTDTANALAAAVGKFPAKTVPFALVAFDPLIAPTDPVIAEVAEALKKQWMTFPNAFKGGTPVNVMRAILAAGLHKSALGNDAVAVGVAATARNVLPHMELGDEGEIWEKIVHKVEAKADERAEREWAMPENIALPDFTKPSIPATEIQVAHRKVDQETLATAIRAASGPQAQIPEQGNIPTNGNPHWPQTNHVWVGEYGKRMAEAVAAAVDASTGSFSVRSPDLSGAMDAVADAAITHMGAAMQAVSAAAAGLQRRTNLLWWKEALYSPSGRESYRRMPEMTAAALMAFDLHCQVPMFSPASVSAFLREAVQVLPGAEGERNVPLRDLVEHARSADGLEPLRECASMITAAPDGRGPLLALIGHLQASQRVDDTQFRDLTGLPPETAMTLPGWAAWLFGELQAIRATVEATPTRRRASRK